MGNAKDGGRRGLSVVRTVAAGAAYLEPSITNARHAPPRLRDVVLNGRRYRLVPLDGDASEKVTEEAATNLLTARELEIVARVAQGRVNKQIADDLQISEWTVSTHLRRIFAKLGVDTRAAMVSRCLEALRPPADRGPTR